MANTIILKRSATPGQAPTTGQLSLGEIAINTYDGKLYIKKTVSGVSSIVEIGGVTSVNGESGVVTIDTGDVAENGNLYFTNTRARSALSAGTGISYNSATGAISIGQAVGTSDNVTFNDLTVSGNLIVSGTTTTVNSNTVTVADNILLLNSDWTGAASQNAGIEIERGDDTNVLLQWNETSDKWQFTNNGVTYYPLAANTDDLAEGSTNLYHTTTRARTALSASSATGISYNSGTGTFSLSSIPNSSLTNSSVTIGSTSVALGATETTLAGLTSVTSTSFVGALTGNADTATSAGKWTTSRTITLGGDLTGSVSIDGSAGVTLTATIAANSVALGTDTTGNYMADVSAGTGISISHTAGEGSTATIGIDSTVATLTGTQTLTNKSLSDSTTYFIDETDATKKLQFQLSGITTATTRTLTVPDASGTVALTSNNLSAFAATTSAQLAGVISDETGSGALVFANSPTLVTPALGTPSSVTLTNATGLPVSGITASTTTALGVGSIELGHATDTTIARSAAGVITVEGVVVPTISSTNTLTNKSLSDSTTYFIDETDGTKKMQFQLSGITTATTRTLTVPDATGTLALTSNNLGAFAATTSAQLAGVISDETGSGALVFATSPTLVTPSIGAATGTSLTTTGGGVLARAAATQDGVEIRGRAGGTGNWEVIITPTTLTADRTLTLPDVTGTVVTTGDTGTVTNTMLAGSIANAKLTNSSVTVGTTAISLGASSTTLAGLTSVTSTGFTGTLTGTATGLAGTPNITVGTITSGAIAATGAITATGEITAYFSDANLKTDVAEIEEPITKLMSIRGVTFRPNEKALALGVVDKEEVGVIAQEVEAVLPQLVTDSAFKGYKTVKYDKLTALLIEAVKAQQLQIDALRAELAQMSGSRKATEL
jgi:hypothetical protein